MYPPYFVMPIFGIRVGVYHHIGSFCVPAATQSGRKERQGLQMKELIGEVLKLNRNGDFEKSTLPYIEINNNVPTFNDYYFSDHVFVKNAELDVLGRCGKVYACLGQDILSDLTRKSIAIVKPSGWHSVRYENVPGKYLFNRCHLIGYQLSGINADRRNLITGTRYMNIEGMLPWENMVKQYICKTGNHVMYQVTPMFVDDELVCRGVQIEALSMETYEISFNVFCFNVQPGIKIDYRTGESTGI